MKQSRTDLLPIPVQRALRKLGADISIARRKRRVTTGMMAERIGITPVTYFKVERGDPGVGLGTYAMALFSLGLGTPWADLVDAGRDETGLILDLNRIPKRARARSEPPAR